MFKKIGTTYSGIFGVRVRTFSTLLADFLTNSDGRLQDYLNANSFTASASLKINSVLPLAYFIGIPNLNIINSAFISATLVRRSYPVREVHNDGITTTTGLVCSRTHTKFVTYSQASACRIEVSSVHTSGGLANFTITTYDSRKFVKTLNVWIPTNIEIIPYNNVTRLNLVATPWILTGNYL